MKLKNANKWVWALWLTVFLWTLVLLILELIRPGVVATKFLLPVIWLGLLVSLYFLPSPNFKSTGVNILAGVLVGGIVFILVNGVWGVIAGLTVFLLLLTIKEND